MLTKSDYKHLTDSKAVVKLFEQQTKIVRLETKNKRLVDGINEVLKIIPVGNKVSLILEGLITNK